MPEAAYFGMSRFVMTIVIPSNALVILSGPASSGKSTFAARHFRPSQIVSSDACREMVSDDAADQACSGDAFAILHAIVRARLKRRRLTVVDSTALSADSRSGLRKIAEEFGAPVVVLFFDVSEMTCLMRNEQRARRVPPEVVRRQCAQARQAAERISAEGYFRVYLLSPRDIDQASVQVGRGPTG